MSGPFVYTPHQPLNYHNSPWLNASTAATHTPIIPSLSLGGSPYAPHSIPLPPSPNPGFTVPSFLAGGPVNSVAFPGATGGYSPQTLTADAWINERQRQRIPSWHGAPPAAAAPAPGAWLTMPPTGYPGGGHQRTRSFGEAGYNPYAHQQQQQYWPQPSLAPNAPFIPPPLASPLVPPILIHPWLNGEAPRNDFLFNLASPEFLPMVYAGSGHSRLLTLEEASQPATHPAVAFMRIECDALPAGWVIDVVYNPHYLASVGGQAPPVSLGAVLQVVYMYLQESISQDVWAALDEKMVHEVSRAYTARCRAMGSRELLVRNQGIKRVDFLLGKTEFKGIVRAGGGNGFERMKLIVN